MATATRAALLALASFLAIVPMRAEASLERTHAAELVSRSHALGVAARVDPDPEPRSLFALFVGDELDAAHPASQLELCDLKTRSGGQRLFLCTSIGGDGPVSRNLRWGYELTEPKNAEGLILPLQDELGNVERLTDASGATLERYEYEGYGKFRIFSPTNTSLSISAYAWKWLFQGREWQTNLGVYDFRFRTLWPEMGRFGQEDPAASDRRQSAYQGFGGGWLTSTDPLGLYEEDVHRHLTSFLAEAAGFSQRDADRIGQETQELDNDSPSATSNAPNLRRC